MEERELNEVVRLVKDEVDSQTTACIQKILKDHAASRPNRFELEKIISLLRRYNEYLIEEKNGLHFVSKNPDYKELTERDKEIDNMNYEKLGLDVKNARRVYDTYWITFYLAIAAFIISVLLLVLKLLELSKQ